ncbi:hypothetical protein EIP91_007888 [Steccherinum ochraceum]|uniref:Fungal lipase-type domain-containing protein n=1 Tax=Steccherinum ochraceum TaxID=92696 RepID=A0A4R0R3Q6_9APHY|nr:hypothetical protein EIP91_007888 [Steccherinum ochraceum]
MATLATGIALLSALSAVYAIPTRTLQARQAITTLATSQISMFKPFTFFASAAYCQPSTTINWSCGANCNANSGFQPVASGGDGSDVQFWYVGFDPSLSTVIVAHQGTDPDKIAADLEDANFFLTNLDSTLFPGVSSSVKVHNGFHDSHAKSAPQILSAVQSAMATHSANRVTMVGHSLGAALALLDSVFLPLHLPSTTIFKTVGYGMPRVGNQAFANYVDQHVTSLNHINNKEDVVPILPGMFLGFHHPSGELHIMDNNAWVSCPGQDNDSNDCSTGDVDNIFEGDVSDHDGPYDGVEMGC